jgi:hypothetical protein
MKKRRGSSSVAERMVFQPSGDGSIPILPIQNSRKAHQRLIREQHALEPDPLIDEKKALAASLKNAVVREIDRKTAETIILKYEWLGTMGTTDFQFGLYCGEHLAAVECFGRTAGTRPPRVHLRERVRPPSENTDPWRDRSLGSPARRIVCDFTCLPTNGAEGLSHFRSLR